jgi:hypothetical protein
LCCGQSCAQMWAVITLCASFFEASLSTRAPHVSNSEAQGIELGRQQLSITLGTV